MKTMVVALAAVAVVLTAFGLQCPCPHDEPGGLPIENGCGRCAPDRQPQEDPDECCCVDAHHWTAVSSHPEAGPDAAPAGVAVRHPVAEPCAEAPIPAADTPPVLAEGSPLYLLAGILLR